MAQESGGARSMWSKKFTYDYWMESIGRPNEAYKIRDSEWSKAMGK